MGKDEILWAPNENTLAVTLYNSQLFYSQLLLYDILSQQATILLETPRGEGNLRWETWSPDGKKLVFSSYSDTYAHGLWIVDLDDPSSPQYLLEGERADWSRDGQIAVARADRKNEIIYISIYDSEEGENTFNYSHPGSDIRSLSWSPDGKKLVLLIEDPVDNTLEDAFVLDIDTLKITQLTFDGNNYTPKWSPRGNLIAYTKYEDHDREKGPIFRLHIINSDGSCDIEVPGVTKGWALDWSQDGERIVLMLEGVFLVDLIDVFGTDIYEIEDWPCP
jgi:Tol biopolymer transport system component